MTRSRPGARSILLNLAGISNPHVRPVGFPKSAHGGFRYAALFRRGALPAHFDDRELARRRVRSALHEPDGRAVLHGDETGRTDQIGLAQAQRVERIVVALKAEAGPHQLAALEPLRHDA